jgi:hypothetical protein
MAKVQLDLTELAEQAKNMEHKLGELLAQMKQSIEQQTSEDEESVHQEAVEEQGLSDDDQRHIERLFEQAAADRSGAYELKRELDRLGAYREYEDRFLDLFKKPE